MSNLRIIRDGQTYLTYANYTRRPDVFDVSSGLRSIYSGFPVMVPGKVLTEVNVMRPACDVVDKFKLIF